MTCHVVLTLSRKWGINIFKATTTVSEGAAGINGTSACLVAGDTLSIWDLLFGLMLPSGNDSALVLAEHFGSLLLNRENRPHLPNSEETVQRFLDEMNIEAKKHQLTSTYFDSPHGLSNIKNKSTAYDIGRLSCICMKHEHFRKVVGT